MERDILELEQNPNNEGSFQSLAAKQSLSDRRLSTAVY